MKVVIITGGSDGIGRSLCLEYGSNDYHVVFTGRNSEKLEKTSSLLKQKNIPHHYFQLDASSESDNKQLVEKTLEAYGRLDVLICNAGISMRSLFEDLDMEMFQKVMQVNFTGVVSLVHAALPSLIESKGHIIGVSSINGRRATPARTAYVASKHAMEGFLTSLRMELMHRKVSVLVVCPGFTSTSMRKSSLMPDGKEQGFSKLDESKMMQPETVARKVHRAMKKNKRDLILTTQGKWAVRTNKFFPSLMDKVVFRVMARKPDSPFYKS